MTLHGSLKGLLFPDHLGRCAMFKRCLCSESSDSPSRASANSPARQGVKVPFLGVKRLVFHSSQSKANGQHGESEDEEACDPKRSSPGVKPAHRGRKGVSALRTPQGIFTPFSRSSP